jgi:hypothetical protein
MKGGEMTQIAEGFEPSTNVVRINRLKEGHSWSVIVTADDNSDGALQKAKEQALQIVRELQSELDEAKTDTEMPF